MATFNFEGVDSKHASVEQHSRQWRRVRDVVSGEDAIHGGGVLYLPRMKKESNADYKARQARAGFYNATWRTIAGLVGMVFRKEPTLTVPTAIEGFLEDVTMSGVSFTDFAEEVTYETISVGFSGILVDHPPAPDTGGTPLTVAVAERLGLRPTMALYKAEAIGNWAFRRIRNKWTLSQVRLWETVEIPDADNEFKSKSVEQIRVLDLNPAADDTYRQRRFRKETASGKWTQFEGDIVPIMDGKPLDYIPFTFITPNGTVAEVDDPALIDLVDLNLKHYLVTADYEHACHFTALPTPMLWGVGNKVDEAGRPMATEIYLGSTSALIFENPEGHGEFLEFSGQGIDAVEKNLTRKEAQMAAIGARMLAPEKTGVEASETLAIRHSGENSVLAKIANSASSGLSMALGWFAAWAGAGGEAVINLNRDFLPVAMDPATLQAYMAAWQQGGLSEVEFFELLQRGDVVRGDKTLEDHQAEIDAAPPMGMQVAQAGIEAMLDPPDPANKKDKKDDKKA